MVDRIPPEPAEGVPDYVRFDRELADVDDVGVERAPTERIAAVGPAVRRRLEDFARYRIRHPPFGALDPGAHAFSRDGAADEHDLPQMTRDHPAARRRLFDRQIDLLA